ncbi:MAG: transporter [Myxococcota bacterium]
MAARTAAAMGVFVAVSLVFVVAQAEEAGEIAATETVSAAEAAPAEDASASDADADADAAAEKAVEEPAKPSAEASAKTQDPKPAAPEREKVGQRPQQPPPRPTVTTLTEVGGVLTPRGTLRFEPSVEFTHTSISRFNVNGFEVADSSVLIGNFEAFRADRDSLIQSLTTRYGITNRFEVDLRVPVVWRKERVSNTIPDGMSSTFSDSIRAYDLGDIEFGAHYQINSGLDGMPYFIGNLRVKSNSGVGPFEVDRSTTGLEEELPTGSGFWGINPSLTIISRQDPAVVFANIGYVLNLERDVDEVLSQMPGAMTLQTRRVGNVNPGDAITASVGMGLAVNQDFSFNIGFGYTFIRPTDTELITETISTGAGPTTRTVTTLNQTSSDFQAGSVLFGFGYRFSQNLATSVDIAIGATEDAPDFRVNLRVPYTIPIGSLGSLFSSD